MATFTIDTNAGPIVTLQRRSPAEVKSYMESSIPLLAKRGYRPPMDSPQRLVRHRHLQQPRAARPQRRLQERIPPMTETRTEPLPEIGQRIISRHGDHVVWEGEVTEIVVQPGLRDQIVARTNQGLMFTCFSDSWEAWLSPREQIAAQISVEVYAQLSELSDETCRLLRDGDEFEDDKEFAEDLRETLYVSVEQRLSDFLADRGIG
jgi:hypothetical protein